MKTVAVVIVLCTCGLVLAADWKPAAAPLMTRWAKDVRPDNVLSEYPRPQMVRKDWQSLNGLWEYSADNNEHGQILVPFCIESALSGVGKHLDRFTYRRTFDVPKTWTGKRILLHFGAVDYESTVSINGKAMGKHVGGYDSFNYDITDALKQDGPQEVTVAVTDTTAESQARGKQINTPSGILYTPCSGIWQTVWIEPVPDVYIHAIRIETEIDGALGPRSVAFHVEAPDAHDPKYRFSALVESEDKWPEMSSSSAGMAFNLPLAKLWSPDNPQFYTARIRLRQGDRIVDEVTTYFGIRKIEVSPDDKGIPRIKLNGKPIMMVGPLDQGFWPDGIYTAPTDDALKYDLEMEKKLGFNCLRKHVKIEPQRFYYWCDKLGILVWQDMPSTFLSKPNEAAQKQFETELAAMVEQHINSPAIMMWVPINEGWGQAAYGIDGTKHLVEMIKKIDPSRLVDNSSGWTDCGTGDVHDIHSYPGPAAPAVEKQRAVVLGEFGGIGFNVDHHVWNASAWAYTRLQSQDDMTDRYERLLGRLWELHDESGLCAGIFTQITDVETECNGLMTYDREVLKVDADRVRLANLGKGPRVDIKPLIATAREQAATWKYTTDKPADGWEMPAFDDSHWKSGPSGFGTEGTPGATVRTTWNTPDIWLRREIDLPAEAMKDAELFVHHDEACEISINGVRTARLHGFTTDYIEVGLRGNSRAALKPGKNLIAAHCNQTTGGQYFDLGFVKLVERKN